jgi:chromosome transmission fidelity protein 4
VFLFLSFFFIYFFYREAVTGGVATGIKVYDTEPGHQDYVRANIIKHSEDVECIAVSNNGFASGGTDGLVLLYTSKNLFDKILVRSTVPVRDLAYHPNGTKLAIATE